MSKHNSLRHAIDILDLFSIDNRELGVTDISKKLGISISNASRLLKTMNSLEFLNKDKETRKYFLGSKILKLAKIYFSTIDIKRIAHPHLIDINEKTSEMVTLNKIENDKCILLDWIESKQPIRPAISERDMYPPLYAVSPGKVLFAFLPKDKINELIESTKLIKITNQTITNKNELKKEILKIRNEGIAVGKGEFIDHVWSVSAPVYNWKEEVIAALAISWLQLDDNTDNLGKYKDIVLNASQSLSFDLGYKFFLVDC